MRQPAGDSADRLIAANGLPHSDERGAGRYGLPHLVGIQQPVRKSISLRHFWGDEIDEKMQETVLLNWEPTGGLEPPAFSLPRKCW